MVYIEDAAAMKRHTPRWALKIEREHEAKNPGPAQKRSLEEKTSKLVVEVINVTSAKTNRDIILKREARSQFLLDTCLTKTQRVAMQIRVKKTKQKPAPKIEEFEECFVR